MARILGMKDATLSRIESGIITPNIEVILAYHLILGIPVTKLFKEHARLLIDLSLDTSLDLEQYLLDQKASPSISKRLDLLTIIIDRLKTLNNEYEN